MADSAEIQHAVHFFLTETTGQSSLATDTDLLASGLLDSLTMMDLVVFIEVEFQHRISVNDMRPENFRTIGTIAALIEELNRNARNTRAA